MQGSWDRAVGAARPSSTTDTHVLRASWEGGERSRACLGADCGRRKVGRGTLRSCSEEAGGERGEGVVRFVLFPLELEAPGDGVGLGVQLIGKEKPLEGQMATWRDLQKGVWQLCQG